MIFDPVKYAHFLKTSNEATAAFAGNPYENTYLKLTRDADAAYAALFSSDDEFTPFMGEASKP